MKMLILPGLHLLATIIVNKYKQIVHFMTFQHWNV